MFKYRYEKNPGQIDGFMSPIVFASHHTQYLHPKSKTNATQHMIFYYEL